MIVDEFFALAEAAGTLLRAPEITARWDEPSALAEYRVSGLAGHLVKGGVLRILDWLDEPVRDGLPQVDAVAFYTGALHPDMPLDDPVNANIRAASAKTAEDGPAALADLYDASIAELRTGLADLPPDRLMSAIRVTIPLDQWLLTRMVELAVHADDLAVSLDLPTPELPPVAADLVLTTLVRLATAHHGTIAVLRALSRRERSTEPICAF